MDRWAVNLDLKVQASATSSAVTSVIELTDLSCIGNDGAELALPMANGTVEGGRGGADCSGWGMARHVRRATTCNK